MKISIELKCDYFNNFNYIFFTHIDNIDNI